MASERLGRARQDSICSISSERSTSSHQLVSLAGSDGDDFDDPEDVRSLRKKMRRSCDRCTEKKVRCDGTANCDNCTRRGYLCHYSERKRTGPKIRTALDEHPFLAQVSIVQGALPRYPTGDQRPPLREPPAPARATSSGPAPVGPPTFSPSQSTNSLQDAAAPSWFPPTPQDVSTLGKSEGQFLDVFFNDFNSFLPITDESATRSALVQLMAGRQLPLQTVVPQSRTNDPALASSLADIQQQNAHNAILWGSIGIGALLAGHQSDVGRYATLAWLSIKECFDHSSRSTVSAYLVLSILYHLLGEIDRHRRYLRMADSMAQDMECLPTELEIVIRFLKVGYVGEDGMMEYFYRNVSTMDFPSEIPRLKALHLLTRVKTGLIYNRHLNKLNEKGGGPNVDAPHAQLLDDLLAAEQLLADGPAAGSAYGLAYVHGIQGMLSLFLRRDPKEVLAIMSPIVEVIMRRPGIMRMMPIWHFVHCVGVLSASDGNTHNYNILRRAQESTELMDQVRLPEVDDTGFVELNCEHPVCKEVCKITMPNGESRVSSLRPLPITWREPVVGIPPVPTVTEGHDETDPYSDFGIDHLDHFLSDFQLVF